MGKAALDLPDPLEEPTAGGASPASADDLLSQLAGEEIDRLLAEAETDRPGAAPDTAEPLAALNVSDEARAQVAPSSEDSTDSHAASVATSAVAEQLDALFAQLDKTDSPSAPTPASTSDVDAVVVVNSEHLDQAIAQASPSLLSQAAADQASASPEESTALAGPAVGSDTGTTAAERSLLDAVDSAAQEDDAEVDQSTVTNDIDALGAPLPIVFKPLVWINAPFAALSPGLREALGKIAVLTLVNAIAVLLYVLIFR